MRKPSFIPKRLICKTRDGIALSADEIQFMVDGIKDGTLSDSQIAAWAMAILLTSITSKETAQLTYAMAHSGATLNWEKYHLPGPVIDKHSCGGVGDKTSLIMVPLLAACGAFVPKLSGGGLGHTGGTIDKLHSIPGYRTDILLDEFQTIVSEIGCANIAASKEIAPADKRFYNIRDVTGSVESITLITASILSKKLATGAQHIVIDATYGNGANMPTLDMATTTARSMVEIAKLNHVNCSAILTNMNFVRGKHAGNSVEIAEVIEFLTSKRRCADLMKVIETLATQALTMSKLAENQQQAIQLIHQKLDNGEAAEKFAKMVSRLGGPNDLLENPDKHLPKAPIQIEVKADKAGFVSAIDAKRLGLMIIKLGGGHRVPDDKLDYSVGLCDVIKPSSKVDKGQPLLTIHAGNHRDLDIIEQKIRESITISDQPCAAAEIITDIISE